MITRPALGELILFLSLPSRESASRLVSIPALYRVLEFELDNMGTFSPALIRLCLWIACRANDVLSLLTQQRALETQPEAKDSDGGWQAVGVEIMG